MTAPSAQRLVVHVSGRVQGVGFRWWTRCQARELGLPGVARNLPDGRVEVVTEGPPAALGELLRRLGAADVEGRPGEVVGITGARSPACGDLSRFVEE